MLFSRTVNISIPKKTRNNGTLYALVFVHQAGVTPWQDPRQVHLAAQLTAYMVPKPPEISLITGEDQTQVRRTQARFMKFHRLTNQLPGSFSYSESHSKGCHGRGSPDQTTQRRKSGVGPARLALALPPDAQHRGRPFCVRQGTPSE